VATLATHSARADERTDEQLLADYRHGDKSTFQLLVQRYHRELYHFLVRFVGDRQLADDVFQETFLQVHQSVETFDLTRRFRPWLFAIAANKGRDMIRQVNRKVFSALSATIEPMENASAEFVDMMRSTMLPPDSQLEKRELQKKVQQTVMGMPEHLREVLLLCYFHQFPYKQVGEMLDIPLGTVKSRLHAAIAHFADKWREIDSNPKGN
jgi:RNA polymerase sigma-70 factor (ECF subfamily)